MYIIEPCCVKRHLRALRDAIAKGGTRQFAGYGDLSLSELMPAMMIRYSQAEMLIATPSLPDQAAEVIDRWMHRQWARVDGQGKVDVISHLTIIAKLEKEQSHYITSWMEDKPFGDRLTLIDTEQEDTAILLPDFAITGPVNMRYGNNFTATVTTEPEKVKMLWESMASRATRASEPSKPSKPSTPSEASKASKKKTKKQKKKAI